MYRIFGNHSPCCIVELSRTQDSEQILREALGKNVWSLPTIPNQRTVTLGGLRHHEVPGIVLPRVRERNAIVCY